MGEPTRRQEQARERREHLIESALSVFAERGVRGASVKDLSEAAGVANGLLYHYFRDKQDLLRAVVERNDFVPEMRQALRAQDGRPVREVLTAFLGRFAELLAANDRMVRLYVREAQTDARVRERWLEMVTTGAEAVAEYLRAQVAAGKLRPHDTSVAAVSLLHTVFMAHLTGIPRGEYTERLAEHLLDGICTE